MRRMFFLNARRHMAKTEAKMSSTRQTIEEVLFLYDPRIPDERQAKLILTHYPHGTDLRGNPLEQPLLYSGDADGPARYMRVFAIAAEEASIDERRVAFLLESWNGARRRPGKWDTRIVLHLQDHILSLLTAMAEGERKNRLAELCWYHTGLTAHLLGDFDRAADAQDTAGKLAQKRRDKDSGYICAMQAAYERACGALVKYLRAPPEETRKAGETALYALHAFPDRNGLDNDATTTTKRRWTNGNGPVQRLLLHSLEREMLCCRQLDDLDALCTYASSTEGACFADWAFLLTWIRPEAPTPKDLLTDDARKRCAQIAETSGADVELRAFALFVHADILMTKKMRRVQSENRTLGLYCSRGAQRVINLITEAKRLCQEILDLPDHGAVLLREYARRRIEALQAELPDTSLAMSLQAFLKSLKGPPN